VQEPQTLSEAIRYYSNEQTCIDLLASIRWPDGQVICTSCGEIGNTIWLANQKRWKCRGCKKQFSVKVGTIMEDSPIGLDKWMVAFWMLSNCRNGVSSYEIKRANFANGISGLVGSNAFQGLTCGWSAPCGETD
jgi:transposase-like protein